MRAFDYARAQTPADAIGTDARIIAGGTNLLDLMKLQVETPERLIDINHVGLDQVERDGEAAWVAMRDVGSLLLPGGVRLSRAESRRILATAGDLHREFRGEAPSHAATLEARVGMSSPAIGEAEHLPHVVGAHRACRMRNRLVEQ